MLLGIAPAQLTSVPTQAGIGVAMAAGYLLTPPDLFDSSSLLCSDLSGSAVGEIMREPLDALRERIALRGTVDQRTKKVGPSDLDLLTQQLNAYAIKFLQVLLQDVECKSFRSVRASGVALAAKRGLLLVAQDRMREDFNFRGHMGQGPHDKCPFHPDPAFGQPEHQLP